jgi:hypothetical protein
LDRQLGAFLRIFANAVKRIADFLWFFSDMGNLVMGRLREFLYDSASRVIAFAVAAWGRIR